MIEPFKMGYTAIGGLGIFILGMKYLSDSLQMLSGGLIRKAISSVTTNRFLAVLVGLFVTTFVQSSSITTVMVVGLTNAGLMQLNQAIGVILGANIGTTITGWILAVKIGKYGLLLIALGVFPMLFSKNERVSASARILVALGMIFFGLEIMSDAFKPLRSDDGFMSLMLSLDAQSLLSVLGCIAIGCMMTMIIQSSSAMLGITIALATTGAIPLYTAIALVMGENIGTTITAQFAALGGSIASRRAAMAHSVFNVLGVVIIVSFFSPYVGMVERIVPGVATFTNADGNHPYIAAHIAMAHTIFNVTATLVMLPFINYLARLVVKIVPEKQGAEKGSFKYIGAPGTIPIAMGIPMIFEELKRMQRRVNKALRHSGSFLQRDLKGRDRFYRKVADLEDETDIIQHEITTFTVTLMQAGNASNTQSDRAYSFIRAADELESIADYAASLCSYMKRLDKYELDYSQDGWDDLIGFHHEVFSFFTQVCKAFSTDDASSTRKIYDEASRLNDLADRIRRAHLDRMKDGSCAALPALTFSDMAVALRRIKNHTVNLHEALFADTSLGA
ncbi:phosphate:Na+ symporter [Desulfuromusa kysingii]|uniref:Phosphate:Na+ symporter n=1 Tax=Desulfuromusa kysingii TaxID=37625 RepID=A0A1H3X8X4_9BACT|nr:Na/Pi cotransporter family protein [Desulfuromusa kysingii]SDZ95104.1 phosphate:Na+ symporter [Desulfuromusa kysingii]